ncbi:MAG: UbiA family prenyltransferase [Deltaproteobacteria bacterium]|jgi:1,4-dihydroxy-2-naphthoate octaprenyltransferase|nr:UbiA family prenyltransferase [Deltaproteobacteria bacterium]
MTDDKPATDRAGQAAEPSGEPLAEPLSASLDASLDDTLAKPLAEPLAETLPEPLAEPLSGPPPQPAAKFPWRAWLQASRPSFFVATLAPLLTGYFAAVKYDGRADVGLFILVALACFLVHLATNLCNDVFDHAQGVDSPDSIGGSRVIQEGRLSPRQIKLAAALCYAAALGLAVIVIGDRKPLWIVAIFAALSSFFYVAPPVKYGHRALGELFVFVNMGLIMTVGCHWALTDRFDPRTAALAVPIGLMVAQILYFQSLPEIETDPAAGKNTLASTLGKPRAILVQGLWWPLVWLQIVTLWCAGLTAWPALLGLLTLPVHWLLVRKLNRATDWLKLDNYGWLVRGLYFVNALFLIVGLALADAPPPASKPQPPIKTAPAAKPATTVPAAAAVEPATPAAPLVEPSEPAPATEPVEPSAPTSEAKQPEPVEPETAEPAEPEAAAAIEPAEPGGSAPTAAPSEPAVPAELDEPDSAPTTEPALADPRNSAVPTTKPI